MNKLRQLIRESIGNYISEIDKAGEMAGHKAKMQATEEAIRKRKTMVTLDDLDEDIKQMVDERKVKEVNSEIKALEKSLVKLQKQFDKFNSKANKGEKVEDTEENKEIVDEVVIDEMDSESDSQLEELDNMDIYEILHMQKMAGIISESEYVVKIEEAKKKKASADMTKKEKSAVVKKARVGKDIDKKDKS
jgi:hypothetical protein